MGRPVTPGGFFIARVVRAPQSRNLQIVASSVAKSVFSRFFGFP
jgi:hypothetical protein